MAVVSKWKVGSVESFEYSVNVRLSPVYAGEGADPKVTSKEDGSFWEATPNGKLEMTVNNPLAAEQFQPGDVFYISFTRADG